MIKQITCIECPQGCSMSATIENNKVNKVEGNVCQKGEIYARNEIENPIRYLTSTVTAKGLSLKMIPVKTDRPVPKAKISELMNEIKKIKLTKPVKIGDVIVYNLLNLNVNLVATRDVSV